APGACLRSLRLSFWALVLPPLLAGGPACAQTATQTAVQSGGWQPAASASSAPAPSVPRPVPVEVAPLAGPLTGWAPAPATPLAETAPPALRSAPLTETAAPLASAPLTIAAPSPAAQPVVAMPPAPMAAPAMRAPLAKTYGPQRLAFADGVSAQFDVT